MDSDQLEFDFVNELSKDSLGDRMKKYESTVTEKYLDLDLPVYARIDGRSFHSFCKKLDKPFDEWFTYTMIETCNHLVDEFGAIVGYVQSDEISLGWENCHKAPFEGRIFKLTSTLASEATIAFALNYSVGLDLNCTLKNCVEEDRHMHLWKKYPTFDCRVFNVPNMIELHNMFRWRENDAIKNSISALALDYFSTKELNKVTGEDKIALLKTKHDVDWYKLPDKFRKGSYFRRVNVNKILSKEIVEKIPENKRNYDKDGNVVAIRSEIQEFKLSGDMKDLSAYQATKELFNIE